MIEASVTPHVTIVSGTQSSHQGRGTTGTIGGPGLTCSLSLSCVASTSIPKHRPKHETALVQLLPQACGSDEALCVGLSQLNFNLETRPVRAAVCRVSHSDLVLKSGLPGSSTLLQIEAQLWILKYIQFRTVPREVSRTGGVLCMCEAPPSILIEPLLHKGT